MTFGIWFRKVKSSILVSGGVWPWVSQFIGKNYLILVSVFLMLINRKLIAVMILESLSVLLILLAILLVIFWGYKHNKINKDHVGIYSVLMALLLYLANSANISLTKLDELNAAQAMNCRVAQNILSEPSINKMPMELFNTGVYESNYHYIFAKFGGQKASQALKTKMTLDSANIRIEALWKLNTEIPISNNNQPLIDAFLWYKADLNHAASTTAPFLCTLF